MTLGDECSELRAESFSDWDVETAWWGNSAVVTRSGGLSGGSRGYNWGALYLTYV